MVHQEKSGEIRRNGHTQGHNFCRFPAKNITNISSIFSNLQFYLQTGNVLLFIGFFLQQQFLIFLPTQPKFRTPPSDHKKSQDYYFSDKKWSARSLRMKEACQLFPVQCFWPIEMVQHRPRGHQERHQTEARQVPPVRIPIRTPCNPVWNARIRFWNTQ